MGGNRFPLDNVEFIIPDEEVPSLDWAALRVIGARDYEIGLSLAGRPGTALRLMVPAVIGESSAKKASAIYEELRKLARLPADPTPEISQVSSMHGLPLDADEHIFAAQKLRDENRHELATIEAQTHFEMHMRFDIRAVAWKHGEIVLAIATAQRHWSLADKNAKMLFEILLGRRPAEFPRWREYQAHLERRNEAIHKGLLLSRADADESIDVIVGFVQFVRELTETSFDKTQRP